MTAARNHQQSRLQGRRHMSEPPTDAEAGTPAALSTPVVPLPVPAQKQVYFSVAHVIASQHRRTDRYSDANNRSGTWLRRLASATAFVPLLFAPLAAGPGKAWLERHTGQPEPIVVLADPPPLPPSQPNVPGWQGAPYGSMQLGAPGFPNGPSPTQVDARGVGIGSSAELAGPVDQLPNARPGTAKRSAMGVGPSGGVNSGVLADLDPGVNSTVAPPQTEQPIAPTIGIGGIAPFGHVPQIYPAPATKQQGTR